MTEKRCKYCKYMNVTVIPPSSEQYCTKKRQYVKLTNVCEDFFYDKDIPQKIKEYGDFE